MKIVAVYRNAHQIGPDTWDVWPETLVCAENTTVTDVIRHFQKKGGVEIPTGIQLVISDEAKP